MIFMIVIDATDRVLGRLSSLVAKKLLSGEEVVVVNVADVVISGDPSYIRQKYLKRRQRGDRKKGPFIHRSPDSLFRRAVRGMLPRKKHKGREAYKRLKVFSGFPEEYRNKDIKKFGKGVSNLRCKFMRLKDVSKFLGAKV